MTYTWKNRWERMEAHLVELEEREEIRSCLLYTSPSPRD